MPTDPTPAEDKIGTVRLVVDGVGVRHLFVKLVDPASEPWHIAWSDGPQGMSGWQSDADLKHGVIVGYVPILECMGGDDV